MKRVSSLTLLLAGCLAALVLTARPAAANTFTVRNLNDNGPESLRGSIEAANVIAGVDTIQFQDGLEGTIKLTTQPLIVSSDVIIQGPGAGKVAVSGNNTFPTFFVTAGTVSLSGLTIKDGKASDGSGLFNLGGTAVAVTQCIFENNHNSNVGTITSYAGTLTVHSCTVRNNSGNVSGGIATVGGTTNVTNTVFADNSAVFGGAVACLGGTTKVTGGHISNNRASKGGGGLDVGPGRLILTNVAVSGNTAGSWGGGLRMINNGTASLTNVTLSGNSSDESGGGIHILNGSLAVANVTVAGNSADYRGGGIYSEGGTTTLVNSIVWGNTALEGPQVFQVGNPLGVTYTNVQGGLDGTGNLNVNPLFVRNPGANSPTDYGDLHLQPASPCRNKGNDPDIALDTADLDGDDDTDEPTPYDLDRRPRVKGASVDMGAYESQVPDPLTGDVTSQTIRLVPQSVPNPATRTYLYYVQVKNTSSPATPIAGPVSLVLSGLPAGAQVTNATGRTPDNLPYVQLNPAGGLLAPGQSLLFTVRITSLTPPSADLFIGAQVLAGAR